jgi:hypothetical protein
MTVIAFQRWSGRSISIHNDRYTMHNDQYRWPEVGPVGRSFADLGMARSPPGGANHARGFRLRSSVLAVILDVKNIRRAVQTEGYEQAGKQSLSPCVEGADLVVERVGLAQRVFIQFDQVHAGIKK